MAREAASSLLSSIFSSLNQSFHLFFLELPDSFSSWWFVLYNLTIKQILFFLVCCFFSLLFLLVSEEVFATYHTNFSLTDSGELLPQLSRVWNYICSFCFILKGWIRLFRDKISLYKLSWRWTYDPLCFSFWTSGLNTPVFLIPDTAQPGGTNLSHYPSPGVLEAEGSGIEVQTWLHRVYEASMRYMRSWFKKKNSNLKQINKQPKPRYMANICWVIKF